MLVQRFAKPVKPWRVVILGARGFLAARLGRHLEREGIRCRPVGQAEVDLTASTAPEQLAAILEPSDAVVMTSALTPEHGRDAATFGRNLRMAENVCAAIKRSPCAQVVYISSDSVYDPRCERVTESSPRGTDDPYGRSHLEREALLRKSCPVDPLAILRPSAIYGAGDTHDAYGPNRFLRTARRDGRITLFGQGEERRDHVYIEDVCRAIGLCLLHGSHGVLNVASGTALSFAAVAREVAAAVDRPVTISSVARNRTVAHREFDLSALGAAFPAFHPFGFADGIRQAIREA